MVTRNVRNVAQARILSVTELDMISGTFSMSTFSKWLKEEMYMNHMLLALIKGKALGSCSHSLMPNYSRMIRYCSARMYWQHKKVQCYTKVSFYTVFQWVLRNVFGISLCSLSICRWDLYWPTVKVSVSRKIAFFIVSVTAAADAFLLLLLFQHTVVTYAGLFGGYTRRMWFRSHVHSWGH